MIILRSTNKISISQYVFESIVATKNFKIYDGYEHFCFMKIIELDFYIYLILKVKKVVVLSSIFEKLNGQRIRRKVKVTDEYLFAVITS